MACNSFSKSKGGEPLVNLDLVSFLSKLLPSPEGVAIEKLTAAAVVAVFILLADTVAMCSSSECCELSPSDLPQGLRPLLPTASLNSWYRRPLQAEKEAEMKIQMLSRITIYICNFVN